MAASMKKLRIGYVAPTISHPLSILIREGLLRFCREEGHSLALLSGGFVAGIDAEIRSSPWAYRFADDPSLDGLAVYGAPFGQFGPLEDVRAFLDGLAPKPLVNIGLDVPPYPSVVVDDAAGLEALVAHLVEGHGYANFAWIGGPPVNMESRVREAAVRSALRKRGLDIADEARVDGTFSAESGRAGVCALLDERRLKPRVIVCVDDDTAYGAIQELQRRGVDVPERIAVTGFDNSFMAMSTIPAISTVHQRMEDQGYAAGKLLADVLEGRAAPSVRLPTSPVFRESCGCEPGANALVPTADPVLLSRRATVLAALRGELDLCMADPRRSPAAAIRRILHREADLNLDLFLDAVGELRRISPPPEGRTGRYDIVLHAMYAVASGCRLQEEAVDRIRTVQKHNETAILNKILAAMVGFRNVAGRLDEIRLLFSAREVLVFRQEGERTSLLAMSSADESSAEAVRAAAGPDGGGVARAWLGRALDASEEGLRPVLVPLAFNAKPVGHLAMLVSDEDSFAVDLLASAFSAAFHRMSLVERLRDRSRRLRDSIRDLEKTTARLHESERIASLGTMVVGIAHELNTPLGVALTTAGGLRGGIEDLAGAVRGDRLRRSDLDAFLALGEEGSEILLRNLDRAITLVRVFKQVAVEEDGGQAEDLDLASCVAEIVASWEHRFAKAGIRLALDAPAALPARAAFASVKQVLDLALQNALDHAWPDAPPPGAARVEVSVAESDGTVVLRVQDNGRGPSPATLRQFFSPFYTSGRAQGHVGLGGYLIFNVARSLLRGQASIAPAPEGGLLLTVELPRVADS